jgi:hypothetical protein
MKGNESGCFAEYKFATMAMEEGFNVSMPLLDSSPYDAIIEKDGETFKIQIKYISADRKKRRNDFHLSLGRRSGQSFYSLEYVDFFAIYYAEESGFFIIKNKEQRAIRLSMTGIYKNNFSNFALITK